MRSTIIMATCALAVFAAPVPEAEPIHKSSGTGCARVVAGVCVSTGKREVEAPVSASIETRFPEANVRNKKTSRSFKFDSKRSASPFGRGSHPRDIEIDARSSEPFGRGSHPRDVEDDEASFEARSPAPSPLGRGSHSRDVEAQDDIEARAIRNEGNRSVRGPGKSIDTIDARAIRNQGGHKARTVDNIEARGAVRNQDKRSVRGPKNPVDTIDTIDARAVRPSNKRSDMDVEAREAEPFTRAKPGNRRRDAEPEAYGRAGAGRREAEPEAYGRAGAGRRDAEAEPALARPKGSRSPAPEAEAEAEPGTVRASN